MPYAATTLGKNAKFQDALKALYVYLQLKGRRGLREKIVPAVLGWLDIFFLARHRRYIFRIFDGDISFRRYSFEKNNFFICLYRFLF